MAANSIAGISGPLAVSFPASHFVIGAAASTTAGNALVFAVTALDQFNNTANGYGATVHFSSSDSKANLPAGATLTSGIGYFAAILKTAGSQTLTVSDAITSSITGLSSTIAIVSSGPFFYVSGVPTNIAAGTPFNFTVTAENPFNSTATGYSGTVHFSTHDGQATLPADSTLTHGVGSFTAIFKTAGSQALAVTDTLSAIQRPINRGHELASVW